MGAGPGGSRASSATFRPTVAAIEMAIAGVGAPEEDEEEEEEEPEFPNLGDLEAEAFGGMEPMLTILFEEVEASGAEARNATKGELYHLRRHFPQLLAVRLDVRPTAVRPAVPWQGDWRWCAFRYADGRFAWSEP